MSFKTVNIVDAQLEDITSELNLPIVTGSSSNTYQRFPSNSASTSQVIFNIQVPSLSTAVSRKFLVTTKIILKIDFADDIEPDQTVFSYAESDALQAFPFNSLVTTAQASINNTSLTCNTNQIIAPLLKLYNPEELAKFNSLCPSLVDAFYLNYAQGVGSNNNCLGGYNVGSYNREYIPRGAFPVTITSDLEGKLILPYTIKSAAPGNAGDPAVYPRSIYVSFITTEPILFLSPLISGSSVDQSAFIGINNMNLTFNIGQCNKVWSSGTFVKTVSGGVKSVSAIKNISLPTPFQAPSMLLNFFTLPPTLYSKLSSKNVCHYNQYASYTYQYGQDLASQATQEIAFSNVQLNQIPTKMIIIARKKLSDQTWENSNSFLTITKLSMNFNNHSGILASANQQQLYNMSIQNGSTQNYYEFSGAGAVGSSYVADVTGDLVKNDGTNCIIPTTGSVLVIDPAIDLGLDVEYSNCSSGQFNIQFNVTVTNQTKDTFQPELLLICVNSGIFTTENGSSSIETGLFNREMVLETKSKPGILDSMSFKTITGGALENVNSIHKHLKCMFSRNGDHEKEVDNGQHYENGNGMSAGSFSAGSVKRIHRYSQKR